VVPSWEFDGRATSWNRFPLGDCQRPNVLRCRGCQRATRVRCDATREDRCQGCGKRHNRRLKRLISSGFTGRPSGFFFGTLTAPGIDVLPWDDSACSHRPGVPCSGKRGCRVHSLDVARWNGHAPQAWSWFVTASRRELAGVDVQFWKCWETQDRGALHCHAIVWAQGVSEARLREAWNAARLLPSRFGSRATGSFGATSGSWIESGQG